MRLMHGDCPLVGGHRPGCGPSTPILSGGAAGSRGKLLNQRVEAGFLLMSADELGLAEEFCLPGVLPILLTGLATRCHGGSRRLR
jgi:hypothetical protein